MGDRTSCTDADCVRRRGFEAEVRRILCGHDVSISLGRGGRILLRSDECSIISGARVELNLCGMHLV